MIDAICRDLIYSFRTLRKRPLETAILLVILMLGIGGAGSIFAIVDGVLIEPLPFKDSDRIVKIYGAEGPPSGDRLAWWGQAEALESIAEFQSGGVTALIGGRATRVSAAAVSRDFNSLLHAVTNQGRWLDPSDELDNSDETAVISDHMWSEDFGSSPSILGRSILLNARQYTIVGVMERGFGFPGHTDIWIPLRGGAAHTSEIGSSLQSDLPMGLRSAMIARLREHVTISTASNELSTLLLREMATFYPRRKVEKPLIGVVSLKETMVRNWRLSLLLLFGATGFLFLISCCNATNLLLARSSTRRRSVAIRRSLGARTSDIVRQALTESLLVAVAAGVGAIILSEWCVHLARLWRPPEVPRLADLFIGAHAIGFTLALALVAGIVVGTAPAIQLLRRQDVAVALKTDASTPIGTGRQRVYGAFAVIQIALTIALLSGAGAMLTSLRNALTQPTGFDRGSAIVASFDLPARLYKSNLPQTSHASGLASSTAPSSTPDDSKIALFHSQMMVEISRLPGVTAVGAVDLLPLAGEVAGSLFIEDGINPTEARVFQVSGDYFQAMGIPILIGRGFSETDIHTSPKVIILNRTLASHFFGDSNPIGKAIELDGEQPRQVVGVVGDVKFETLTENHEFEMYLPFLQAYAGAPAPRDMSIVVRTSQDSNEIQTKVQDAFAHIDPNVPLYDIENLEGLISGSSSMSRFRSGILSIFAVLALTLAVLGVYGVMNHSTVSRLHEFGVRMSVGAHPNDIMLLVFRSGSRLVLTGIVLGLGLSFWSNQLLKVFLYQVSPSDPKVLAISAAVILLVTAFACFLPARAAGRLDPCITLRYE